MRGSLPVAVLVLVVSLMSVLPALEAQQEVGKVVALTGRLTETQLWDGATRQLSLGDPVRSGTRLECGTDCRAGLLVNGESAVLEMEESTTIENPSDEAAAEPGFSGWEFVRQIAGRIRVFFTDSSRRFSVDTPQGHIAARNTAFAVEVERSRTLVWTFEGMVEVTAVTGGAPVVLSAGEMTMVRTGRQPTPPTPFDPGSGATASGAVPPPIDRPAEKQPDPPLFPVPEELPPRRGIDDPNAGGGG